MSTTPGLACATATFASSTPPTYHQSISVSRRRRSWLRNEGVDPFENYESRSETTYGTYLGAIAAAFDRVEGCLAPDSRVVVDVANVKTDEGVRPLAWDVGRAVADVFDFRGEIVVAWEGADDGAGVYGYGYDHSYGLVYDA